MPCEDQRRCSVGDIREMFHRVGMKKDDQRSQMIFWDDLRGEPAVYVVTVMTFGAACSPTSAQFVKNRNASRFRQDFPRAVECIEEEHYVDDMLVNVETEEEAAELAKTVRYIHAKGGFEIRNWASNSRKVVDSMQEGPTPILNDHGILRVGGRLTECVGINNSSRNPIILPRRDYGTDLIIREQHERYKHGNHNTVLSELRMRYRAN